MNGSKQRLVWILLAVLVPSTFAIFYYLSLEFSSVEADRSLLSNLGFFVLININIITVLVLGFLVFKNIIRLIFDRRRNILGSRLRSRLVFTFVGLSMIPTVLLFLVARGILDSALEEWFAPEIDTSVDGSYNIARLYYEIEERRVKNYSSYLATSLSRLYSVVHSGNNLGDISSEQQESEMSLIKNLLEAKRKEYGLLHIAILDRAGREIISVRDSAKKSENVVLAGINLAVLKNSFSGSAIVRPEQSLKDEFLRGYVAISPPSPLGLSSVELDAGDVKVSLDGGQITKPRAEMALVSTLWIEPKVSETLAQVINSYDDYSELKSYRKPIVSSYVLTLVVVTLLIIFAAIWVGFYLAKTLTVPIQLLAEGTAQVSGGNLDYFIPEVGDDELGVLVNSFNKMTHELKDITSELVESQHYIEAVFASVQVGIISIDTASKITTINRLAREICGMELSAQVIVGSTFDKVLPEELSHKISNMLVQLARSPERVITEDVSFFNKEQSSKQIQLTITKLMGDDLRLVGAVVLFDDITELVNAQRMLAWREVARRIAHEIKNPLTPIQLSAERVQRRFQTRKEGVLEEKDMQVVSEATSMIVKQVESLRNLVNEFSQFARMPKANPRPEKIAGLIEEVISLYHGSYPGIDFVLNLESDLPDVSIDREQISRVLINVIDNGIASIKSYQEHVGEGVLSAAKKMAQTLVQPFAPQKVERGLIEISTSYRGDLSMLRIEIADTGLGLASADKDKIFEPYYTTKKGGTGLGMTIVSSIISDHSGYIRVKDNQPHGLRVVIELPAVG